MNSPNIRAMNLSSEIFENRGSPRRRLPAFTEIYKLAADMGGAGYIFTGEHDANVMHNCVNINLNTLKYGLKAG
jgi:hypothetical protein